MEKGSESKIRQADLSAGAGKASRMANLELLRCIAMMMVVVLHYLGKGGILPDLAGDTLTAAGRAAWALESCCIVAVNLYMLLSGYFLCLSSFKLSRLIQLYVQVWLYSAGVGALSLAAGIFPPAQLTVHDVLTMVFPVSMGHYWFITAYVFLYILLPFLSSIVKSMTKRQMQLGIGLLLFFFCILKTILPVRLEMDGLGYDCIWYLCVFMTAAYIRRFGIGILKKRNRSCLLYVAGVLLIFGLTMALRRVYLNTGSLGRMIKMGTEYNHLFPFLASLGLFGIFLNVEINGITAVMIKKIAPYSLGVYLLHENLGLRYAWQKWLGAERIAGMTNPGGSIGAGLAGADAVAVAARGATGVDAVSAIVQEAVGGDPVSAAVQQAAGSGAAADILWLLAGTALAVLLVFAAGILVDWLRSVLTRSLHRLLLKWKPYRLAAEKVADADRLFAAGERTV